MPLVLLLSILLADLVINEVLYDPPGSDGDAEFVELLNPSDEPISLEGVELYFVNGGVAAEAKRIWSASAGTSIPPHGFFVVGEADVAAAAQARLDLQNGPDALWLTRDEALIDAVAWGEAASEGGEGLAAPDVASTSIGRVPDGVDTGSNAQDFRALVRPTPGGVNLPGHWIEPVSTTTDPQWRADPGEIEWTSTWVAMGWQPLQRARVDVAGEQIDLELAFADTVVVSRFERLSVGEHRRVFGGAASALGFARQDTSIVVLGLGDVRIAELQPRPATGEPEWFELLLHRQTGFDSRGWSIADATGMLRRLGEMAAPSGAERLVVTADGASLRTAYPELDPALVFEPAGGWPTLNDGSTSSPDAVADELKLIDPRGVVVDRVVYRRADLGEKGESLQRISAIRDGQTLWIRSGGVATPGFAHPAENVGLPLHRLELDPDPFTPDGDGIDDRLQIVVETDGAAATAQIRDLDGRLVRSLVGAVGSELAHWQWDGVDDRGNVVPVGAYVVLIELGAKSGSRRLRALVGVGGRR